VISRSEPEPPFGTVGHESMPRFAPGGEALVFVSGQTSSLNELHVQRLREGRPAGASIPLTRYGEGEVDHPAVSRDGRWVAYYRVVRGQRDIWTVPWDGGPSERITTNEANDIQPAWSPSGDRLAFASERGGSRNIWTIPIADGRAAGTEVQVTRRDGRAEAPEWSPDGEWIAYVSGPTPANAEVWVTRADGSGTPRQVTSKAGAYRVRWPRDRQMVVSGKWGDPLLSLRLVDPATGAATAFEPPVVLGDDEGSCDFDIDLDRGFAVFARRVSKGNIWILRVRQ
jgi:hypothetical protein